MKTRVRIARCVVVAMALALCSCTTIRTTAGGTQPREIGLPESQRSNALHGSLNKKSHAPATQGSSADRSSSPQLTEQQIAARDEVDRVVHQFVTLVDEARRSPDGLTFQLFLRVMKLQPKTSRGDPMLENYGASLDGGWGYALVYRPQEKTGESGFLMFFLEDPVHRADRKKRSPRITVCSDFGRLADKLTARGFTSHPAGNDWVFDDRDTRDNFWINVLTSREFDTHDFARDPSEERECVREIYVNYMFRKR